MKRLTNFQIMSNLKVRHSSLQKRMGLFFLFLLSIIVIATLTIVWRTTYNHLTVQLQSQFKTANAVIEERITNSVKALEADLEPVAKDFTTKKLIASAVTDPSSLRSAMENFIENRWGTDIYWVLDENADTLVSSESGEGFSVAEVENLAANGIHWHQYQNNFYLMKAMPVRFVEQSGHINAWIVTGINIDKLFGQQIAELTNMNVSVYHGGSNTIISSSILDNSIQLSIELGIHEFNVDSQHYLYATSELGYWLNTPVHAVMAKKEDDAYLSNQTLRNELFGVLILAAILAWIAAVLVSRSITRPLEELIKVAKNISRGNYTQTLPASNSREVETLSKSISDMQDGIFEREKAINKLAYFDELTGLPNRLQFSQYIEGLIQQPSTDSFIVLTLDIDRFKEINDTVGHEIGDKLLQLIAQRLPSYAEYPPFFARLSGDEFGIVFNPVGMASAELIAEKVVGLFEQPFNIGDLVLDIDTSVGIAVYPEHAQTFQGMLQCADIAMYSCKEQHYRHAVYTPELNKYSVMRLNLMSELKGALLAGQLQLHYQPKLSLHNNVIATVECLIRWIHPEHGFVPPDEFIPLAEQTGAIRNVTNWALDIALKQVSDWQHEGIHLGVAVNISAMDLVDLKLPTYIAELLTQYKLTPDILTIEVTESAVMSNPDNAFKALNILKTMGVTLSIDDFGTGYSSMAQLKKMPVHELKIDKTFVLDLASNKGDQIMVKTLISLANNLSLNTVAEGVEDKQSLQLLKEYGCTKAQGFYMSKALPAPQFALWYHEFNQSQILG